MLLGHTKEQYQKVTVFIYTMIMPYPDFFQNRSSYRTFEEVVVFIHKHFIVSPRAFRVGEKQNTSEENQRACCVLAYAVLMNYTFEQTKALFGEHDHLCLALPHMKQDKNIYQLNNIYRALLQQGYGKEVSLKDFPDMIAIPLDVLVLT